MTGTTRVDILDASTGDVVDHCYGPTLADLCPRLDQDGSAPCHGHRIVPLGAGPESWLRWVPSTTQGCPLTWNQDVGAVESP
jgi:hypothetical protein